MIWDRQVFQMARQIADINVFHGDFTNKFVSSARHGRRHKSEYKAKELLVIVESPWVILFNWYKVVKI